MVALSTPSTKTKDLTNAALQGCSCLHCLHMQMGQKGRILAAPELLCDHKDLSLSRHMYSATGTEVGLMTQPISIVHKWVMSEAAQLG